MVEKELIQEAAMTTADLGAQEVAKVAADVAVKEAVGEFGWKEGLVTGLTCIGGVTVVAGIVFGAVKLTKFIAKKAKEKKPIPVAEEAVEQPVEVEKEEQTTVEVE